MVSFRRRLAERSADVMDWVDYRPEPNFWPFFALPPMLSVAWAYGGWIGLGLLATFALLMAVAGAVVFLVSALAWIVANALLDLIPPIRLPAMRRPELARAVLPTDRGFSTRR